MGIIMIRHYRISCNGNNCYNAEEYSGASETKETMKSIAIKQGWKVKGNKCYCDRCFAELQKGVKKK